MTQAVVMAEDGPRGLGDDGSVVEIEDEGGDDKDENRGTGRCGERAAVDQCDGDGGGVVAIWRRGLDKIWLKTTMEKNRRRRRVLTRSLAESATRDEVETR